MTQAGCDDYPRILASPTAAGQFVQQKVASKIRWWRQNRRRYEGRSWPAWQDRVLEILYADNLDIRVPGDGELVCKAGNVLVVDWRSRCHILRCCQQTGADTLQVCSVLYHVQYQALLSLICPGAFFARDYSRLRPDADSCREVIIRVPADLAGIGKEPLWPPS
jgi:hypothetical protein